MSTSCSYVGRPPMWPASSAASRASSSASGSGLSVMHRLYPWAGARNAAPARWVNRLAEDGEVEREGRVDAAEVPGDERDLRGGGRGVVAAGLEADGATVGAAGRVAAELVAADRGDDGALADVLVERHHVDPGAADGDGG